ncbi:PIN domain-containing protein [Avibacterium sp. 21-595]|uniref:type II toxin-antitoxin system VapC family toxin n=1 Tax=Avibacterium sp. 21-595 TaxID=2911527 RepID=UPI002025F281|nr:PIN domain-containing protein [Avibacterium sp. 21-595]URL06514.1 PIN domain-containing protein [Avibacterium sp. 21-595]
MKRNILLDSNILMIAISDKKSNERKQLINLLKDENINVFVTPLIRYEILRGVTWNDNEAFKNHSEALKQLETINIDQKISDTATLLFRLEREIRQQNGQTPKKIDKHNFDVMHFATAKVYQLEWLSNDKDMQSWEELYQQLKTAQETQ